MASIGTILKRQREKKKISISDISASTKIPEKYLTAIEKGDYSVFPAETYLVGFIRNYARELDLDVNEIVSMYKNSKLEKEDSEKISYVSKEVHEKTKPVMVKKEPEVKEKKKVKENKVEENKDKPVSEKNINAKPSISSFASFVRFIFKNPVALLLTSGFFVFIVVLILLLVNLRGCSLKSAKQKDTELAILNLDKNEVVYNLNLSEYYKLKVGREFYSVMGEILNTEENVSETGTINIVFHLNDSVFQLPQSITKNIDLDLDGTQDLAFKVVSISEDGFSLNIKKLHEFPTNIVVPQTNVSTNTFKKAPTPVKAKDNAFRSVGEKKKIVFHAEVKRKSYVKAWVDSHEQEGKVYYPGGIIDFVAQNTIQLKIGNPGGLKVTINGKDVKLGGVGVVNKTIKWKRDLLDENVYNLTISDWQ